MSASYQLANLTRHERVSFEHVGAWKRSELCGNPAAAAITSWYLFHRIGDRIVFVPDEQVDGVTWVSIEDWPDCTDQIVCELIDYGILADEGLRWQDEEESHLYVRNLQNIWMDDRRRNNR